MSIACVSNLEKRQEINQCTTALFILLLHTSSFFLIETHHREHVQSVTVPTGNAAHARALSPPTKGTKNLDTVSATQRTFEEAKNNWTNWYVAVRRRGRARLWERGTGVKLNCNDERGPGSVRLR